MIKEEMKLILKKKALPISFIESTHKYRYGNEEYKSVTTLISEYSQEFDVDGKILKDCAEKEGISTIELSAKWDRQRKDSCDFGTNIHSYAELLCNNITFKEVVDKKCESFVLSIINFISDYNVNVLDTEVLVYSKEHKVAGQIDLITINEDNTLTLWDWKTNKYIDTENKYNKFLKYELSHIPDLNFYKYSLQLSCYKNLLEQWGFVVSNINLIHLTPNNYKIIPCKYMRESETILKGGI